MISPIGTRLAGLGRIVRGGGLRLLVRQFHAIFALAWLREILGSRFMGKLHDVLREHEIQSPVHGDPQFLFKPWQFAQVDRPPNPPGKEARKPEPENIGNTSSLSNGGELSDGRKDIGLPRLSAN